MKWHHGFALLAPFCAASAAAQPASDYPARPVRLIIPFTAGGSNDIVARILAQKLTERWGRQLISDNRAGANGVIGTDLAAKANPDGYTLLVASTTFAINPAVQKMPFDPRKDFAA